MNADVIIATVIQALGGVGGVIAAFAFVGRGWLKSYFDKSVAAHNAALQEQISARLETHKSSLQADLEGHKSALTGGLESHKLYLTLGLEAVKHSQTKELESHRQETGVLGAVRQQHLTRLEAKTVEAVETTYGDLRTYHARAANYVSIHQVLDRHDSLAKELDEAALTFWPAFFKNRLYLPGDVADRVEAFADKIYRESRLFRIAVHQGRVSEQKKSDVWMKVDKFLNNEAKTTFDELERAFRKLVSHERQWASTSAALPAESSSTPALLPPDDALKKSG